MADTNELSLPGSVPVSNIVLGTMYFGSRISQTQSERLLDTFVSMGGNQIDTARCYADWIPDGAGASEKAIGKWLSGRKRESVFLGTKGGIKPRGYNATRGDLSQENLEKDLKASLTALQTDYIDLYWLHRDDLRFSPGEIVERMNQWIRQGYIRYFGVSNWTAKRIMEANEYAASHGLSGAVASQIQYGLGICTPSDWGDSTIVCMDNSEYMAYEKLQIPVYGYSAQAEGYFPLYIRGGSGALGSDTRKKYDTPVNRIRADRLKQLMKKKQYSLSWIMAEYVLRSSFPAMFIMGGSNESRMKEIMGQYNCGKKQLTDEEWEIILKTTP